MSSKPFLGFVLLTHEKPVQVLRLIDRLTFMFDDPPIVCHHDFSKCELPVDSVSENVSFVRPHLETGWGDWSLVEATLKGIELLFNREDAPEWFILLSGTDYPIAPADKILDDYRHSHVDAQIAIAKLTKSTLDNDFKKETFIRYRTLRFTYPSIPHLFQSLRTFSWWKKPIYLKESLKTRWLIPFNDQFFCCVGSQWFSANRKAASYILRFQKKHPLIRAYYKRVHAPDESYFHTILGNSDQLTIENENWRNITWIPPQAPPKTLVTEDLERLVSSGDHFARKFNIEKDSEILDRLDEVIGYRQNNVV